MPFSDNYRDKDQMELTVEIIRELLDYDPDTGVFVRTSGRRAGCATGWANERGYVNISLLGKNRLAHRLAFIHFHGRFPSNLIDHINGDTSDNRIANLREVDICQNGYNRKLGRNNSSGRVGVHYVKARGEFRADIKVGRERKILGHFTTFDEACVVRDKAEIEEFGQFRRAL